jgi:hypothetical protein
MEWALDSEVFSVGGHGVALRAKERGEVGGLLYAGYFFGVVGHEGIWPSIKKRFYIQNIDGIFDMNYSK